MTFIKTAAVQTIAVAVFEDNRLTKSAAYDEDSTSEFLNERKPIDIKAALEIVASEYDISSNPSDYIFEAIRGNTANVPNENKDAFHKHELLRFDGRLGKQVYRTYENKPHHINHRAENPKNARGFIVDAHYNDSTPALDECSNPNCGNKTASEEERDPETGIHCRKCGEVVKDEFVELLVAIDTKKDPTFARGVQAGILKHGSMGCSCLRTRCNVCNKVAYSRNEFCDHIKNKGKAYDESEPGFNPIAFVIEYGKDKTAKVAKKIAKAYEWCEGVIYDEYSRVHDPADTKAEQYEILQLSAKVAQLTSEDQLQNESDILILSQKVADLERRVGEKLSKVAQATPEIPAMPPPPPGLPGPGSAAPGPVAPGLEDPTLGLEGPPPEEDKSEGGVTVIINAGPEGVEVESPQLEETALDNKSIDDLLPEDVNATPAGVGEMMSPAAMGLEEGPKAVPPKLGNKETSGGSPMLRFAESYKHLKAEITSAGNVRVFDADGTLFVVKPDSVDTSKVASVEPEDLAKNVLTTIAQYGVGTAINMTRAIVGPRLAQVLQYYHDDMTGVDRGEPTAPVSGDGDTDAKDKPASPDDSVTAGGADSDRKDEYDNTVTLKDDALSDRDSDLEDEQNDRDPNSLSTGDDEDSDMKEKRKDWSLSQSAVDDVSTDMKNAAKDKKDKKDKDCKKCKCDPCKCDKEKKAEAYDIKQHASRIETLYKGRLAQKVAELEDEKKQFVSNMADRFARAIKLVAKRQALNLEYSPMKTAMGIALCNPMPLGEGYEYAPMDQKTAVSVVEAAFTSPIIEGTDKPAWEAFVDGLIERAGSVMEWNDETLMQVEADLGNIKTAAVPLDESAIAVETTGNVQLRQAMANGNLQLNPTEDAGPKTEAAGDKRTAIRDAVGVTKVAGLANLGR